LLKTRRSAKKNRPRIFTDERGFAKEVLIGEIAEKRRTEIAGRNRKGRDIGYALAANSCEGVNNVESCTITAFDVITAFAVPNPGLILAD
jgi:hypothetical protein